MKSLISHIEFNVIDYKRSIQFYDLVFPFIGLKKLNCTHDYTSYTDGSSKIILAPTDNRYREGGFHRKRPGLNHLAFYSESQKRVDQFYKEILVKNNIESLYECGPFGDENYYAVFFEDPDRLKLEYVYAPNYCRVGYWPNNLPNDFDPYL
ncbi:MAG: VOC family protein [Bdellovibrionales bacterium]|nr:VOC family protein [Bdellovibrionales bacterium]